ncbi:CBS domain-containing protein [Desulfogranum marinum]|uniref:CBS domain-containing protein n=1 Tax=Desulfogranum marinum TaxID=453220 RepID=UPI0019651283|nr:CBS domain-containing protein [Desulfogranum marinum]MBM9513224.1 CBS domain-containing protein [Desulfogranum marinum]
MSTGAFCNREVVIAERSTEIITLAQLMRKHHVGDVVVVDKQGEKVVPIGVITDRDIVVELVAAEQDLASVTANDLISRELVTGLDTESIWDALQRMRRRGIRRMPVVNDAGSLEGILTVDDIIELLADELSMLAAISGRSREQEQKTRD